MFTPLHPSSAYKTLRSCLAFSVMWFLSINFLFAQEWEVGANLGASQYRGDIAPSWHAGNTRVAGKAYVGYHLSEEATWRNAIGAYRLAADEAKLSTLFFQQRQLSFRTTALLYTSVLEYHFKKFRTTKRENSSLYVFGGIGAGWFFTNTEDFQGLSLAENFISPVIPLGLGIKQKLSANLDLAIELETIHAFSDNVDGLESALENSAFMQGTGEVGDNIDYQRFRQKVNERNDWFFSLGISLIYRFYNVKCPSPSYLSQ